MSARVLDEAPILEALRDLREDAPHADYTPRARTWFASGLRRGPARSRIRWPFVASLAAACAAAGVVLTLPYPSIELDTLKRAAPAAALTEGRADNGASGRAIVVGTEPLLEGAAGGGRVYAPGDALPFGVVLVPPLGRTAGFRIGRAEVRMDPGAALALDADASAYAMSLSAGRAAFDVHPADRPVRVRLPDAEVRAESAVFGALVLADGRWSAAVTRGEVQLERPPPARAVAAGQRVGGGPAVSIDVRTIPLELGIEARLVRVGRRLVVEGLGDLLARVEIDGREIRTDANGRFRFELAAAPAHVRVMAFDAAGRSATRALVLPARFAAEPRRGPPVATPPSAAPQSATPANTAPATTRTAADVPDDTEVPTPPRRPRIRPRPLDW